MNRPAVSLMDLFRVSQFNPNDRQAFEDADIMQFEVWTADRERIGKVSDILMDDIGQLYYVIVNIGSWLGRKLILIEPEQFRIDRKGHRIDLVNIKREDISQLPGYDATLHQAAQKKGSQVRVRDAAAQSGDALNLRSMAVEASAPLESSAPLGLTPLVQVQTQAQRPSAERSVGQKSADQSALNQVGFNTPGSGSDEAVLDKTSAIPERDLPQATSRVTEQETVRLLEERLIVNRLKRKVGEVVIRKEIETRIVEIPLRREKLIIEQVSPEHKHLATVDLPSQFSDAELANFAQTALNSIESSEFVTAELAHRVLANLSQRNSTVASRVKLVFEDKNLQAEYNRQLAQICDR